MITTVFFYKCIVLLVSPFADFLELRVLLFFRFLVVSNQGQSVAFHGSWEFANCVTSLVHLA